MKLVTKLFPVHHPVIPNRRKRFLQLIVESQPVQQEPEVYCRKLRSSSSGSEDMGLASHAPSLRTASFQTPSFQTPSEKVIISFLLNLVAIGS